MKKKIDGSKINPLTGKKGIKLPGLQREVFKFLDFEDIVKNRYIISSYGNIYEIPYRYDNFLYSKINTVNTSEYISLETNSGKNKSFSVKKILAELFVPMSIDDIRLNRTKILGKVEDGSFKAEHLIRVNNRELLIINLINNKEYLDELVYVDITKPLYDKEFLSYNEILKLVSTHNLSKSKIKRLMRKRYYTL